MGEASNDIWKDIELVKTYLDLETIKYEDEGDRADYLPCQHF